MPVLSDADVGLALPTGGVMSDADVGIAPPSASAPSMTEGLVRSAAEGVPILGGAVNKLEAATNALLAPVVDPLLPDSYQKLPESTFGERYQHALDIQNQKDQSFEAAHPIASTAAGIAGGTAALAPVAETTLGAKLLGLTGKSLPGMVARGAASGAALNAADAAVRGGDPETAAEVGGITGAGGPVVGRAIGNLVQGAKGLINPVGTGVPENLIDVAGVKVPVSTGQMTGDVSTQMMENNALRGGDGQGAQQIAEQFFKGEQGPAVEQARQNIGAQLEPSGRSIISSPHDAATMLSDRLSDIADQRSGQIAAQAQDLAAQRDALRMSLSPTGTVLANSPYEAADFISGAIGNAAENARAAYQNAYDQLAQLPGRFHPATFNRIGNTIRNDLNAGPEPIRVDAQTTPIANAALGDLDDILSGIQQTRDAEGRIQPRPPVTPALVDYARKRLNTFYGDAINAARATNNYADARAMRGVIDSYDDAVQNRLGAGTYMGGDPGNVLNAMQNARGLYSNYRRTFTRQGSGDQVGPIMEQIVGKQEGQAAPPEQIQQWMYGNGAIPVKLGQRLINTFGANSPEVGAVKQGLLSNLTEVPPGKEWDPQATADKINGFLTDKGRTLSQIYFSPAERQQLGAFANALENHASMVNRPTDAIDRMIGRISGANGIPASTSEVLDMLQGASGQGNRGMSAALIGRLKDTLGEDSPEWNALRQAQWERLSQSAEGVNDFGSQKAANRIGEFLNGSGKPVAEALYSPAERERMGNYATLLNQITPKPGTVNYSNTAPVLKMLAMNAAKSIPIMLGAEVAGPLGIVGGYGVKKAGEALAERSAAGRVARSLYQSPATSRAQADSINRMAQRGALISRILTPRQEQQQP